LPPASAAVAPEYPEGLFRELLAEGVLRSSPGKLIENLHWKVVPVLAMLLQ
jgi:hypothetical protein